MLILIIQLKGEMVFDQPATNKLIFILYKIILFSFIIMKSVVKITNVAKLKLVQMLKTHNTNNALFYIKGGGCNGFKYVIEPINSNLDPLDEIVPLDDTNNLRVCRKSLLNLIGTEIDWEADFMGQSFRFDNPNSDSSCGCGATFSIKDFQ